jgi:hypothetical protein
MRHPHHGTPAILIGGGVTCLGLLLALCTPSAGARAADLHIPSCAQFVEFGEKWVGLDEAAAAEILGLPLYALTDADIARIDASLRDCIRSAQSDDDRTLLKQDLNQVPVLRAERDRVRRAFADFVSAKQKAEARLEQIAAKLDALPASPRSRGAVDDAQATVSAIFFELEQKRLRAQVKEPLTEDYPAYSRAMAALARKRQAFAAGARSELATEAGQALQQHRVEFERLALPADDQDATIVLEGIAGGKDVAWLTLREWAALVLGSPENTALNVLRRDTDEGGMLAIEILRPGYSAAEFGFRRRGRQLLLVECGVNGQLAAIETANERQEANGLLIAVARGR